MKYYRRLVALVFALNVLFVVPDILAADLLVTRHFTGLWSQVEHESQGLALQVVEHSSESGWAVAYWYTYGGDRESAWYLGVGPIDGNTVRLELYNASDVGFLEEDKPGDDSVVLIGTMTIVFDSCGSGVVTFETEYEEVGSGAFTIERVAEIKNTHCSGGISDDMDAFAMHGEQHMQLDPAREGISGSGHARYADFPGHSEFEVEVEGLADGTYHMFIGSVDRGEFAVHDGFGEFEFHSPMETGKALLTFDPRGMQIEIHDGSGAVMSSFGDMFDQDEHGHFGDGNDDDHHFGCDEDSGAGHGGGLHDCVEEGESIEIRADLLNTGLIPAASGDAEWEMTSQRIEFSVEIEDIPVDTYVLVVDGQQVDTAAAIEMHGQVFARFRFRDPEVSGMQHLDFDPRGKTVQVLLNDDVILEVDFPAE